MTIQLSGVSKSFNIHTVFEDLTLQIVPRSRIGLIGRNGCGKSTLLKIIMGQLEPDGGAITRTPGVRINYLSQEPKITPTLTLYEEMRSVYREINVLAEEEAALIGKLSDASYSQAEHLAQANRLDFIHREMERLDACNVDARIGRVLKGLGFTLEQYQRKTGEFSGGWQMRINLAKILLEGADVLLLDEPTNHLDLEACEWLESFLTEYPGGLVIVSHDRRFLDQVATDIAELECKNLRLWPGNYTNHLAQKAAETEQLTAAYERQQKELAKQTAFVERFRASATRSTQAKSREKQLEKIERIELPEHDLRRVSFRFPPPQPSGRQILTVRNLGKSYGDNVLFKKLNADVQREQRIFLLGANGTGKTTLLKLILGLEPSDEGEARLGHNARLGYFSQNQLDTLNPDLSVFDTLQEACPDFSNTEIRTLLGRFLFTGEQVFKPVGVLSGGEKSKVALAKLMVSGPNTLLLDEPTNHIDIQTKDVMTQALLDYAGSILCISHDRYFIQELATDIWELYNGHLLTYCGDYEYYLSKRDAMRAQIDAQEKKAPGRNQQVQSVTIAAPSGPTTSPLKERRDTEKQFKKVEKGIMTLESEIAVLEAQLNEPALQQDYQQLQKLSAEIGQKQQQLVQLNEQWLLLADSLN